MSVPAISRSLSDNPENLATSVRFLAAVALVFITICSYGLFCATHRGAWIDFLAATLALIAILAVAAVYLVLRFGVSMMAAKMAFQGILSRGFPIAQGQAPTDLVAKRAAAMTDAVRVAAERQFGAELDWKRTEIAALQSQINPHFLYNTLESIRGQALWEGMDEVAEMTETLSLYFRYGISVKGNTVRLGDELRYVEHYVRIIKYRFGERFSFSIACEDEGLLDCTLPKLTIQPIIENAVRHGLEEKSGVGSVEVRISATEECLLVRVVDDGVGMGEEAIAALNARLRDPHPASEVELDDRRSGIALVNVNARIRLLYGEGYGVFPSSSLGSGTDVEIVLPLIRDLPGSLGGGL